MPNERPEVLAMAMERWKAIIGEIPGPLAAWAFDEWERTHTHRPSPAHIVQLAKKRRAELAAFLPKPPPEPAPFGAPELSDDERARRAALCRELGLRVSTRFPTRREDSA